MELQGNGFKLRNWRLTDAPALQKHAGNVNVSAFLLNRFPSPYTLADAEFFINLKINEQPLTCFVIDINGEACGVISLDMRADIYSKTPLVGYWLSEQHWGKGIMSAAVALIVQYGFKNLDIVCIQALVFDANPASMKVLQNNGFELQGVLKKSIVKNDKIYDEHVFAIYPPSETN